MTFEVRWTESSFKKLQKLDPIIRKRIIDKVKDAAEDPFLFANKLTGVNLYSIRVGDYRVIMTIEMGKMVILVIDVGHRSRIYRKS
jgi:mRNA interferase RelE/StbE